MKNITKEHIKGLKRPAVVYTDWSIDNNDWRILFLDDLNFLNNYNPILKLLVENQDYLTISFKNSFNRLEEEGLPGTLGADEAEKLLNNTYKFWWD